MNSIFNMFPVLKEDLLKELNVAFEAPACSYPGEDGKNHSLEVNAVSEQAGAFLGELRDKRCIWAPETEKLTVTLKMSVDNGAILYTEKGIADKGAEVGLAVRWISKKSNQRGVIPFGIIKDSSRKQSFEFSHSFAKGFLRGSLILEPVLYLASDKDATGAFPWMCKTSGAILGTLNYIELFIDGNSSIFPIVSVSMTDGPLWRVYYDKNCDPMEDLFDSEHVEIQLNQVHPAYPLLQIDEAPASSPLFAETLASALTVVINSARESIGPDWDALMSDKLDYKEGSIADAVHYFVKKLGWNVSDPSTISESIHRFIDAEIKGVKV